MSSAHDFSNRFAIVGVGVTPTGRHPDKSARTLEAEAARLAIEDAGLKRADIDGAINTFAASPNPSGSWVDSYSRVLALPAKFYIGIGRSGAAAINGMLLATQALSLGLANYVVVACAGKRGTPARPEWPQAPARRGSILGVDDMGFTAAASAADIHAMYASRHMHEFGTTSRQLGAIAVAIRQWANLNPDATMFDRPITIEDHQQSRFVVEPLHLLDMCLQSDHGAAYVVTTAERARDLQKPPAYVMGLGLGDQSEEQFWSKTNYTQMAVKTAKEAAFGQAGIELGDIDIAEFYDCFTTEVLFSLEDYGWCKKGEGGPFVESTNLGPDGELPIDTHGGLLSCNYLFDFPGFVEAVRQLRGECGERQVENAEVALVTGHGGEQLMVGMCAMHATLVLGNQG